MNTKIVVNFTTLNNSVTNLNNMATELETIIKEMSTTVESTKTSWQEKDADAFVNNALIFIHNMTQLATITRMFSDAVAKANKDYQDKNEVVTQLVREIEV